MRQETVSGGCGTAPGFRMLHVMELPCACRDHSHWHGIARGRVEGGMCTLPIETQSVIETDIKTW